MNFTVEIVGCSSNFSLITALSLTKNPQLLSNFVGEKLGLNFVETLSAIVLEPRTAEALWNSEIIDLMKLSHNASAEVISADLWNFRPPA